MDTTSGIGAGPSFGARLFRAFRNLSIAAVVLACIGAAGYALSVLNSKTWSVKIDAGKLVVLKGRMLPWGADPWSPTDPALAEAYAPLELMGNNPTHLTEQKFGDRDELDQALFGVIELLAKPRVSSDAPKDLEEGLAFLHRAEKLTGITDEQKTSLTGMRAEVAFYIARTRLQDAQQQVEEAIQQLKLAAQSDSRHARSANQMLLAVEPPAKALSDAMRTAVNTLSQPASALTPPPPPPTPTPADTTPPADPTTPPAGTTPTPTPAPESTTAPAPTTPQDSQTVTR